MAEILRDQVYAEADGRALHWDIYKPEGAGRRAAVILAHGGGWVMGSRTMMADQGVLLASMGFVALAIEYRFVTETPWPAPMQDVRTAIRAAHANAEALGYDADKIFIMGFSAGSHLAQMATFAPPDLFRAENRPYPNAPETVAAVGAFYSPRPLMLGGARVLREATPEAKWPLLSPITHVANAPPTILLHGTGDTVALVISSYAMNEALTKAGRVVDLRLYHQLPHGFDRLPGMLETSIKDTVAFFEREVLDRERFQAGAAAFARAMAAR